MTASEQRFLVIDDDDSARDCIRCHLRDAGFQVDSAADSESGLALFDKLHPTVVFCDLNLPSLSGLTVLQELALRPGRCPIIVTSSQPELSDAVRALRFGASDYLQKPLLDMELLDMAVTRCLNFARLRQENRDYRQQLEQANTDLKTSLALLEQDQRAGRQVQLKMMPPTPLQLGEFQFSHTIVPSLYLSGDFIDYFRVGGDHLVFAIADVSGHGASSAFITVLLKNLFARKRSDYLNRGDGSILSPLQMMELANRELLDTKIGKHLTMCMGVIDLEHDSLCYVNAGHLPQPVLARPQAGSEFLPAEGMPVGLFEQASYNEQHLALPERFVLTLFTDGILEVLPAEGLLAREAFLLDKLQACDASLPALRSRLDLDHVSSGPDDVAVLLVSRAMA